MPEIKTKKTAFRYALEKVARVQCKPPIKEEDLPNMEVSDLIRYISINKSDPKIPIQEDIFEPVIEPKEQIKFTIKIKDEISKAGSLQDLMNIFDKYPKLQINQNFTNELTAKKKEIKEKLCLK